MQIVESALRPPRVALALKRGASNRVIKRAFRLLGGKWGGVYDVLIPFDGDGSLARFWQDLLVSADPDYVLVIDPGLSVNDVEEAVTDLRLQPFAVDRLKERQERRSPWRPIFREWPTRITVQRPRERILDHEHSDADWRTIARRGLPNWNTRFGRIRPGEESDAVISSPVALGRLGLTGQPKRGTTWLLLGAFDDAVMACRYWSLRAIGRAPTWYRAGAITNKRLRLPGRQVMVCAPEASEADIVKAAKQWESPFKTVTAITDEAPQRFPRNHVYLASQIETVTPYEGYWRLSLPSPPALQDDYAAAVRCVVEVHLLSPNPEDPDGIVLAPTDSSRAMVSGSAHEQPRRITGRGIAQLSQLSKSALISIPHVGYRQAVNAALAEHGFELTPSDKGLYQQRSLQLAKGLRYLAWVFRQPESRRLLDVFFEYHLDGTPPPSYRRAVRYDELQALLLKHLREALGRSRLRGAAKDNAQRWLAYWTDGLLERGLLLGGHVLRCPICADRSFYLLESLGQQFECRRCMATSPIPGNTPRCFQLNEAVFQLLEHDGEVATLTLAVLRESADLSFLYLPEVVATRDEAERELDVAALVDGELVIGEVKSNGKLTKKEIRNSRFVAKNAKAGRMLFATTAKREELCSARECDACRSQFGEHHADRAWGVEVREEIEKTREILQNEGGKVESFCWYSLQGAFLEQHEPLARFERQP